MSDGAFNDAARAIIYEAGQGRCVGCGRTDLTAQHRRARGMGGTREVSIGHPANGLPLCGSGSTGCHGWAERHPLLAELLGWRLDHATPALGSPWWDRAWGWRKWHQHSDGFISVRTVYASDLDREDAREDAAARFRRWRFPLPRA